MSTRPLSSMRVWTPSLKLSLEIWTLTVSVCLLTSTSQYKRNEKGWSRCLNIAQKLFWPNCCLACRKKWGKMSRRRSLGYTGGGLWSSSKFWLRWRTWLNSWSNLSLIVSNWRHSWSTILCTIDFVRCFWSLTFRLHSTSSCHWVQRTTKSSPKRT